MYTCNELRRGIESSKETTRKLERDLEDALRARSNDPLEHVGKLVFLARALGRASGYGVRDDGTLHKEFDHVEREVAQHIISVAEGDLDVAEVLASKPWGYSAEYPLPEVLPSANMETTPHKERTMSGKSTTALTDTVADLQSKLEAAKTALDEALTSRRDSPVDYIGKLIYDNKMSGGGTYGYDYGNYGDTERKRAQEVIDAAGGDLDIAERFVTQFHIR